MSINLTCANVRCQTDPRFEVNDMPQATPIVFVVDDDVSVRESLAPLIQSAGWQAETFASAKEFLSHPRAHVPHCLVLDVSLPDLSGLDLQDVLAVDRPDMPIVFVTGYGDVPKAVRAMKAGAFEFLTKPFNDNALISAIQNAIDRSRTSLEQKAEMDDLRARYASLSGREREVMELVVAGLLNKQVGGELGISEITVKAHPGASDEEDEGALPCRAGDDERKTKFDPGGEDVSPRE